MKIDYKLAEQTIKNLINSNYKCVLLYGENNSAIETKYSNILDIFKKCGYEISDISPDRLKENENFLAEEFISISMFAGSTLYTLKLLEKENNYTKIIENLFKNNDLSKSENFLVITAGNLDTTSSLRKYAEKCELIACIACYADDKNIGAFIGTKLREYGFNFGTDVTKYLIENIGNNNLIIENEIKKIDLYKGNDRNLTIDDVKKCVCDVAQTNYNDFCNNFCSFEKEKTFRIFNKLIQENIELIVIIRMMARYFLQLQKIRFMVDNGEQLEEVFKKEKIFWKQQNFVKVHVQKWSLNKINLMLEKLIDVEKSVKFNNNKIEFENFLLKSFMYFRAVV